MMLSREEREKREERRKPLQSLSRIHPHPILVVLSAVEKGENEIASAGFEEKDGHLTEVEVDEVLRLVRDVRAEVAAHDAVPSGIVLFVELLLDVAGDVFLDVVLLQRLSRAVHGILLHVFCHVGIFNHSLAVRHVEFRGLAR